MTGFTQAITASIAAFMATNIDDIIVLMVFFSRIKPAFHPRHIVIGQYLGFLVLVLASLPGFLGGLVIPKMWLGLLGLLPLAIGLQQLVAGEPEATVQTIDEESYTKDAWWQRSGLLTLFHPQIYQVAAVTIANGGDNISIYVPLFANSNGATLGIVLIVFSLLVAVWCGAAYYLTRHSVIAHYLTHYGHRLVPFVLIGLGVFLLVESRTYKLVFPD